MMINLVLCFAHITKIYFCFNFNRKIKVKKKKCFKLKTLFFYEVSVGVKLPNKVSVFLKQFSKPIIDNN